MRVYSSTPADFRLTHADQPAETCRITFVRATHLPQYGLDPSHFPKAVDLPSSIGLVTVFSSHDGLPGCRLFLQQSGVNVPIDGPAQFRIRFLCTRYLPIMWITARSERVSITMPSFM